MSDQRLFSAPTTRNEITLIQRSVLDVAQRSRPARGRVHVTVQQRRGLAGATLSLIRWAMTYCQVRGRAASLSPKSRPKIPLPAQSALCLPRNLLTTAHTVRKMHKFLNGRCVPYDGQAGTAIGCSVSASVFSHRAMRHRRAACLALLSTFPTLNPGSLWKHCRSTRPQRVMITGSIFCLCL